MSGARRRLGVKTELRDNAPIVGFHCKRLMKLFDLIRRGGLDVGEKLPGTAAIARFFYRNGVLGVFPYRRIIIAAVVATDKQKSAEPRVRTGFSQVRPPSVERAVK